MMMMMMTNLSLMLCIHLAMITLSVERRGTQGDFSDTAVVLCLLSSPAHSRSTQREPSLPPSPARTRRIANLYLAGANNADETVRIWADYRRQMAEARASIGCRHFAPGDERSIFSFEVYQRPNAALICRWSKLTLRRFRSFSWNVESVGLL